MLTLVDFLPNWLLLFVSPLFHLSFSPCQSAGHPICSKSRSRSGIWALICWSCWEISCHNLYIPLNNATLYIAQEINELFLKTGKDDHLLAETIGNWINHKILSWIPFFFFFFPNLKAVSFELIVQSLFPVLLVKLTLTFYWYFKVLLLICKDVATRWSLQRARNLKII